MSYSVLRRFFWVALIVCAVLVASDAIYRARAASAKQEWVVATSSGEYLDRACKATASNTVSCADGVYFGVKAIRKFRPDERAVPKNLP